MGNSVYKSVFGDCEVRVLMAGLDAAGKTTILYKLKLGEVVTTIPTIGFNVETVPHNDFSLAMWDVGCRDKMRPLMRHYYKGTDGLIFVIDSKDKERYEEAVVDFLGMVSKDSELDKDIPILILANKQDYDDIMTVQEITDDLTHRDFLQRRHWKVFGVCGTTGNGLSESLDWLTGQLGHLQYRRGCLRNLLPKYPSIPTFSNDDKNETSKDNTPSKLSDNAKQSYYRKFLEPIKSWIALGK